MTWHVKAADVDSLASFISAQGSNLNTVFQAVQNAEDGIDNLADFSGSSADAVRAYFKEAHATMRTAITSLFNDIQNKYEVFDKAFYAIDSSTSSDIESQTLDDVEKDFKSYEGSEKDIRSKCAQALKGIDDIISLPTPSAWDQKLADCGQVAKKLKKDLDDLNSKQSAELATLRSSLSDLNVLLNKYKDNRDLDCDSYTPGSVANSLVFPKIMADEQAATTYATQNADTIASVENSIAQAQIAENYSGSVDMSTLGAQALASGHVYVDKYGNLCGDGSAEAKAYLADLEASGTFKIGDVVFSASGEVLVGAKALAEGKFSIGVDGIQASGDASVFAGVKVDAKASANWGVLGVSAAGSAMAGAEAGADGKIDFNPYTGQTDIEAGVDAFAGAKATGDLSADIGPVGADLKASAQAGIGVEASGKVENEDGKVTVTLDLGISLGVGVEVKPKISFDYRKLAHEAEDAWRGITSWF